MNSFSSIFALKTAHMPEHEVLSGTPIKKFALTVNNCALRNSTAMGHNTAVFLSSKNKDICQWLQRHSGMENPLKNIDLLVAPSAREEHCPFPSLRSYPSFSVKK